MGTMIDESRGVCLLDQRTLSTLQLTFNTCDTGIGDVLLARTSPLVFSTLQLAFNTCDIAGIGDSLCAGTATIG